MRYPDPQPETFVYRLKIVTRTQRAARAVELSARAAGAYGSAVHRLDRRQWLVVVLCADTALRAVSAAIPAQYAGEMLLARD